MTRAQLEHIVRAAGAITDESVILVLGSQSILGAFPLVTRHRSMFHARPMSARCTLRKKPT